MSHKAPPEFKKIFSKDELDEAYATFQVFDEDSSGDISSAELGSVLSKLGEDAKPARLRKLIADVDKDGDGTVNFGEFLHVYAGIKKSNKSGGRSGGARGASAGRGGSRSRRGSKGSRGSRGSKSGGKGGMIAGASSAFGGIVARAEKEITRLGGATTDTSHSFSDEEKVAFVDHINMVLRSDPDLKGVLPINSTNMDLFKSVKDGLVINKLINDAVPDTVDERVLNKKKLNTFKIHENQVLAVKSAQAIGCNVTNIGAEDMINGTPHLVLGLLWQIIKIGLFAQINLVNHPELYRLLEPGETIDDLLALPIEQILIRWVNYHLKASGSQKRIRNFGGDIKDSEAYTLLLNQISPNVCDKAPLKQGDLTKRAEMVLVRADKLDCRKFVTPKDIVKGNTKLNLAFVANLFNTHPALEPVEVPELDELDIIETREEKTFRNWMNSLGVDPFVTNLYHDLRSGVILLQLFKIIEPGSVEDKKVNWNPTSPFKKVENCNYAVAIGKSLNFSLVGIQGKDIVDGSKTLTLALVWQMMRHHVLSILKRLSKDGKAVGDDDILKWARKTLKANQPNLNTPLKGTKMGSFKDGSLKNGLVLIALLESIKNGAVDYNVISKSNNMGNAKYCISLARKLGATVFALPEDIVEVKGKMIMTLVASIMAVALDK